MNASEVADGLALPKMTKRKWYIHGACAMTGDGIFESMKEMADMIKEHKKHKGY
jgi:ADP-ribosylation factor protein 1